MLVIRNEKFIKKDGELYLVGSSSNDLYRNNLYQMGEIEILGWEVESIDQDPLKLVQLLHDERLHVHLYPERLPFKEKIKVIKKEVKSAKCLSLKFCFVDSLVACHYANKFKKKYVIESGTDCFKSTWYHGGSIKYKIMAIPYELIAKFYHKKAQYIVYVSKYYLQKKYRSKAYQIGCSDTVLMDADDEVLSNRLRRIETNRKIVLGLIGAAHAEYRGHDILIKVMSELRNKGYDVCVRFLGGKKDWEKRIAVAETLDVRDYVIFDGYKDKKGVFEWINNIDILVMPTLAETLGRAVIEAMSYGCPVIGSKETALPEQIGSDCIVHARDITGIVTIIEHMIKDKEYMKYCAMENFYRAKKYNSSITNEERKLFYNRFYSDNKIQVRSGEDA